MPLTLDGLSSTPKARQRERDVVGRARQSDGGAPVGAVLRQGLDAAVALLLVWCSRSTGQANSCGSVKPLRLNLLLWSDRHAKASR